MTEPFYAQIELFGGNFAPRGYAFCDGQLLPISSNTALFSILGTTYGGDGRTTFGLPDLRGRVAVHAGGGNPGPGLTPYRLGEFGGVENVTLNNLEMPSHNHLASVTEGNASLPVYSTGGAEDSSDPAGHILTNSGTDLFTSEQANGYYGALAPVHSTSVALGSTGGGQSHENRRPFTVINYIIALYGIYPSRS